METYKYTKSREIMQRALKVIPAGVYGHQGPSEGCMIPISAYPSFQAKAKGSYFWDADGNRYIDFMCAYGPNVLGYCDEDVDAAAEAQIKEGNCVTLPNVAMVNLAEKMCSITKKDWTFFAKNGGDVTQYSIMVARAHTGKKKIIFVNGFYHGVAPWCKKADDAGVLEDDCKNSLYVDFNDVEGLKKIIEKNKDDIAAFIGTPYMHGNFVDNILPAPGYWQAVRELCTQYGIVLIIDDVRCGFRLDLSGSDHFYGFEADLICFCKAIANGYNISALCGKDFLRGSAGSVMYTGSYWMSAVPFVAGLACINKLEANNACEHFRKMGLLFTDGLKKIARERGVNLSVTGEPALFYIMIKDDDTLDLHQEWIAECVRRGLWLTNHHNHFLNLSMTPEIIEEALEIAAEAMDVLVANHPEVYKK